MMKLWKNTKTLDGLIDELAITDKKEEADVALLGGKTIDVAEFPKLKGIFRAGVSRDNLPFEEAEKRNIKICLPSEKTANYIYEETADFTCYSILNMFYRNTGTLSPWIKNNRQALSERNLLLIGLGKIGSKVQNKMKNFMNVETFDIQNNTLKELKSMISKADCISLHIPNTKENKNFIDREKLSWMKDGAILVNTARGPIVSEEDLCQELKDNRIYAAFDVYWQEPYDGILKEFHPERFVMTPHIASTCDEFLQSAAKDLKQLFVSLGNGTNLTKL